MSSREREAERERYPVEAPPAEAPEAEPSRRDHLLLAGRPYADQAAVLRSGVDGSPPPQPPSHRLRLQLKGRPYAEQAGILRPTAAHETAAHGTAGAGERLPHADVIQGAFGRHDVGGVQAHSGAPARAAADALGAEAFARGEHVAFAGPPSLHTAAHEAAHVVQQRAGVSLEGGVGAAGDPWEQHADAVADRVTAGEAAEDLLDHLPAGGGAGEGGVQRKETRGAGGPKAPAARSYESVRRVVVDYCEKSLSVSPTKDLEANRKSLYGRLLAEKERDPREAALALGAHDTTVGVVAAEVLRFIRAVRTDDVRSGARAAPAGPAEVTPALAFFVEATGGAAFPVDPSVAVDPEGTKEPLDLAALADAAWTEATGKGAAWNPLVYPNTAYRTELYDQLGFAEILGEEKGGEDTGGAEDKGGTAPTAPTGGTAPKVEAPTPTPTKTPPPVTPTPAPGNAPAPTTGAQGDKAQKKPERRVFGWREGSPGGKRRAGGSLALPELSQELKDVLLGPGQANPLPAGASVQWSLHTRDRLIEFGVKLPTAPKWLLLAVDAAKLVSVVGPAAGDLFAKVGVSSERAVIDEKRNELTFQLGPKGNVEKHVVGFELDDLLKRVLAGDLSGLRPTRLRLELSNVGTVDYARGGQVTTTKKPSGGVGGEFPADLDPLKEKLGIQGDAEASVRWGGGQLWLAAGAKGKAPSLAVVVEVERLADRIEAALEKLGELGAKLLAKLRGGPKKKKGWLSKLLPVLHDGVLWLGGVAHGVGIRVADLLVRLVSLGGDLGELLLSLLPDHLSFGIGIDLDVDLSLTLWDSAWPPGGFDFELPALDLSLGDLPATLLQALEAVGAGLGAAGKVVLQGAARAGAAAGAGALFVFRVLVDGVARLVVAFDPMKALAKLGKALLDVAKHFLPKKSAKANLKMTVGRDLVLRLHEGPNQLGFDLRRLFDGVAAEDAVPVEIAYHGKNVDVEYGTPAKNGTPPKREKPGEKLLVDKPRGPGTLPIVLPAPRRIAAYFGADEKKPVPDVAFSAHLVSNDGGGLALLADYPADKPERRLRLDVRGGARLSKLMGRYGGEPEEEAKKAPSDPKPARKPGSSGYFRVDKGLSDAARGLGLLYVRAKASGQETLQLGVGYSFEKLVDAASEPDLLLRPTVAHLGVHQKFHVRAGEGMPAPGWATVKLAQVPLTGRLAALVGAKDGQTGTVYGPGRFDPESKTGLHLFVRAGAYGGELFVTAALVQKVATRLSGLIAAAQKGLAAVAKAKGKLAKGRKVVAQLAAEGLTLRLSDSEKNFVRYGWGALLNLASGGVDLETLIPDALSLDSGNLAVALGRGAAGAARPKDALGLEYKALPGVFRSILGPLGVSEGDRIEFPKDGKDLIQGGRVTLSVWVGRGADWRVLTVAFPVEDLIDLLVPDFVAKKLRAGKRKKDSGFGIELPTAAQPELRVRLGKKGESKVFIVAGWSVARLIELLTKLDAVMADPLGADLAPTSFEMAISRKKFRVALGVNSGGWKPDGKAPADLGILEDLFDGLKDMLGTDRDIAFYGDVSAERFVASLKEAATGDGFVEVAGCYVVATKPGAPTDRMVFSARLSLHRSMALKFARAVPVLGQAVRTIQGIAHLLENPEDLKHAPAAIYEMITILPEIGKMLGRVDWSSVKIGKTLLKAFMGDLPSFQQAKELARFIKAAKAAGIELPDTISAEQLDKALNNVDDAYAFIDQFAKLTDADRQKLFEALKKLPEGQRGEVPEDVQALLATPGGLDDLKGRLQADAATAKQLEGDILALGEAAATAHAVKSGGGSEKAADEAFREALAAAKARHKAGSAPAGKDDKGKDDKGAAGKEPPDPNAPLIGAKLAVGEPYRSLVTWTLEKKDTALTVERLRALIGKYAPMDVAALTAALEAFQGDAAEKGFLVMLLAYRSGLIRDLAGLKAMTEKDLPRIVAMVKAQQAFAAAGLTIDVRRAIRGNVRWRGKLGWEARTVLAHVKALPEGVPPGAAHDSPEFVRAVAQLQAELGGLPVDGVAGPETIKRLYEKRVYPGNAQALRRDPVYQKTKAEIDATKTRKAVDETQIEMEPPAVPDTRRLTEEEFVTIFQPRIVANQPDFAADVVILARLQAKAKGGGVTADGLTWQPPEAPRYTATVRESGGKPLLDVRVIFHWVSTGTPALHHRPLQTFVVDPARGRAHESMVLDGKADALSQLFRSLLVVGPKRDGHVTPALPAGEYPLRDSPYTVRFLAPPAPAREPNLDGTVTFAFRNLRFQLRHESKAQYVAAGGRLHLADAGAFTDLLQPYALPNYTVATGVDAVKAAPGTPWDEALEAAGVKAG